MSERKQPKFPYLGLWLLIAVALGLFVAYSFMDDFSISGYTLKKGTFKETLMPQDDTEDLFADIYSSYGVSSDAGIEDALAKENSAPPDTTVKSVLVFGDSMTILVARRLAAYGKQNGYNVVAVTWDASSTVKWSSCDTLDNYITRYNPDFFVVTLGSNELFLKNFDARIKNVSEIIKKFNGKPFIWVGPPNWKEDEGFNAMMLKTLPAGTYFVSEGIELPRGPDNIHPTPHGGRIWTDSIMRWMPSSLHPIPAALPDSTIGSPAFRSIYIPAHPNHATTTTVTEEKESEEAVETAAGESNGEVDTPREEVIQKPDSI